MSYIANVQGKKPSNHINELNTNYTSTSRSVNVNEEYPYETPYGQNMYNNEPISQYDTEYNNTYRSTLENLRTKTESMNMALESALVPNIIYGQNIVQESSYIFNDTVCPINISSNEYVFRVNMVKFKSDKCRRLCYNKTIHIYSGTHIDPNTGLSVNDTVQYIIDNRINPYNNISYNTFISLNPLLSDIDSNDPLDIGIEIDTGIPSNIINLTKLDYIFPFLGFINNRAIPWNRLIISVDNIDVFAIFNGNGWVDGSLSNPDDREDVKFTYLDIPFKIEYFPAYTDCGEKYGSQTPIFWFGTTDGLVRSDTEYQNNVETYEDWNRTNGFERIFTSDNHIIYEEFEMDSNSFQNISTTRFGTLYNKRFADFDYRFKIKRFNMLSFECMTGSGAEIRDDFQVESHQFNILKITLDRILTKKRRFKIFYNTRVMYDQDNMLRIKNKQYLADQFEAYMKDVSSNIQVFIDETYALMRKDYGCYLDTAGNEYWYRFDQGGFNTLDGDTSYLIPIDKTILDEENILRPDSVYLTGDTPFLTKKYDDQDYDQLKMRTEIVHFNNMEEGATPTDEFIYYHNSECGILLKDLAKQIFTEDEAIILTTVNNLIDRAYVDNYIIDVTSNSIPKNEWFIRKNLPEMFLYDVDNDEYILDDMGLLDEVFDFTYNDKVSYKENLIHGLQYVIGYDADKLEASILRSIVSRTYTGSDLMQYINNNTLSMARGISTYPNNNYVMIFKNGELYDKYDTIAYDIFNFNVTMIPNTDVVNTDVFEIIYYLNINNKTFPVVYKNITVPSKIKNGVFELGSTYSMDAIPCNTTLYNPENMMIIIDKIPDGEYNDHIDFNTGLTGYSLNYKIKSYKDLIKDTGGEGIRNKITVSTLTDDTMINGLYRVTKQGGGEYFILPSVKPVETTEDPGNVPSGLVGINEYDDGFEPLITPQNITLCSHRQFRYMKSIVSASSDSYKLNLNNEFKYCIYQSHFMIFHNHKIVPMNSIIAHTIDKTPLDKPVLYLDISVSIGDIIEVFYISNDLRSLNSNVENGTKQVNINGQPIDQIQNTAYIRFKSPLYTVSSKHSLFVFLNGKKIPMSNMEDISDTIIKILNNQESCERLEILNHIDNETINDKVFIKDGLSHENDKIQSIDISTLQTYENPCKLDELLNHSSDAQLNTLFETTSSVTGTVAIVNGDYQSKDTILQRILADYVISGDPGEWIANVK